MSDITKVGHQEVTSVLGSDAAAASKKNAPPQKTCFPQISKATVAKGLVVGLVVSVAVAVTVTVGLLCTTLPLWAPILSGVCTFALCVLIIKVYDVQNTKNEVVSLSEAQGSEAQGSEAQGSEVDIKGLFSKLDVAFIMCTKKPCEFVKNNRKNGAFENKATCVKITMLEGVLKQLNELRPNEYSQPFVVRAVSSVSSALACYKASETASHSRSVGLETPPDSRVRLTGGLDNPIVAQIFAYAISDEPVDPDIAARSQHDREDFIQIQEAVCMVNGSLLGLETQVSFATKIPAKKIEFLTKLSENLTSVMVSNLLDADEEIFNAAQAADEAVQKLIEKLNGDGQEAQGSSGTGVSANGVGPVVLSSPSRDQRDHSPTDVSRISEGDIAAIMDKSQYGRGVIEQPDELQEFL